MAKNMPIIKDWFTLGMLTGMASSASKNLVNYVLDKAHLPTTQYTTIAGSMILGRRSRLGFMPNKPRKPSEQAIGLLGDLVMGGIFGTGLSYIYSKTPPGNGFLKGMLGGAAIWMTSLTVGSLLRLGGLARNTPAKMATMFFVSSLFGGLEGHVIDRYGSRNTHQSHPLLVKNVTDESFRMSQSSLQPNEQLHQPDQLQ